MTAIAIFVKTPGLSPVKTRLARTLGTEQAEALYLECAATVAEVVGQASPNVYWAIAEPERQAAAHWPGLAHIAQGPGGLGERMQRVLAALVERHGSGLLLGADAPQIDAALLRRACSWLSCDPPLNACGPARDGGFWTFGANHVPPLERWTRVPYSRPDTLQRFRESIGDETEWLELPMLSDLDTAEDMARVAAELKRLHRPLPSQLALLELLEGRQSAVRVL
ncbi:TIGR04282 family arsenosugar biosynthesis glycosyltransferase [Wenzhouxiangella sp. EGI_FJ10305]|uniref:TIGR04282 family arsenosugar biosynthesis glycosyltransferase n=1 Tax=Wenzhouxiangella sp. EGI_FJ10305 TaxID=3243768 RepID=UPI0035DF916F